MHVFVTGATGWVGSAVVRELLKAGHSVSGLVRSPEKAAELAAVGGEPIIGTLDELDLLRDESAKSNAIVHTAFDHDFSRFAESGEQERRALQAIGETIAGLGPRLIVTSGIALVSPGRLAREQDAASVEHAIPRKAEAIARRLSEQGVPASIVRLAPTVHGIGDRGFVPMLIGIARERGVSAYVGDGSNRWPAVHRSDAARLYRMAVEHEHVEPVYHAIAEEGLPFRTIAEAIGRHLQVPVAARNVDHFGWMAPFAAADVPASSAFTRTILGWAPEGPTLMSDLAQPAYFPNGSSWAAMHLDRGQGVSPGEFASAS